MMRPNNMTDSQVFRQDVARAILLSQQAYEEEQRLRKEKELQEKKLIEKEKKQQIKIFKKQKLNKITKYFDTSNLKFPLSLKDSHTLYLQNMEWKEDYQNYGGRCGLKNLGNSCFMNATLQCLAYTAPFIQLMLLQLHKTRCKRHHLKLFCALCQIEQLLPLMLTKKATLGPVALYSNLQKINSFLTPMCQEDASEFLTSLLEKLELGYDDVNLNGKVKKNDFNPIRELFTGLYKTEVICGGCQTTTSVEEEFYHLSLDVDESTSIDESLTVFSHDELMKGQNKYFCNKCNKKRLARKKMTLSKLPPILIFHFKRFVVNIKDYTINKINKYIEFDEYINFSKSSNYLNDNKKFIDTKYKLYSILVHSGPKLGYGHYYSYIRGPNNKWFQMNDNKVLEVDIKNVLKEKAYLLFYKRCSNNDFVNKINEFTFNDNNNNNYNDTFIPCDEDMESSIDSNNSNKSNTSSEKSNKSSNTPRNEVKDHMINQDYFQSNSCNDLNNINNTNGKHTNSITPKINNLSDQKSLSLNELSSSPYVNINPLIQVPDTIDDYTLDDGSQNIDDVFQSIVRPEEDKQL